MAAPKTGPTASKYNQYTVAKLEEIWAIGGTDLNACFYAGISKDTLYDWLKAYPQLKERREMLREQPILKALRTVQQAMEVDGELALKFLSKRFKQEYSDRVEMTGKDGEQFKIVIDEAHAAAIKKAADGD